jgi:hypothetical protein
MRCVYVTEGGDKVGMLEWEWWYGVERQERREGREREIVSTICLKNITKYWSK